MAIPKKVYLNEEAPRDGWQKYPAILSTDVKIELMKLMVGYGMKSMQIITLDDNPPLIRQFLDYDAVISEMIPYCHKHGVKVSAMSDKPEHIRRAVAYGFDEAGTFLSVSDKISREFGFEPEDAFKRCLEAYKIRDIKVAIGMGCVFGSPFDNDPTPIEKTVNYIDRLTDAGVDPADIGLADTAGKSTPWFAEQLFEALSKNYDVTVFPLHLHNANGCGMATLYKALEWGIDKFDVSLGGMGGCPMDPYAKGNLATEDVVYLLDSMGIETGIDLDRCVEASIRQHELIGNVIDSYHTNNVINKRRLALEK